MSEPGPSSMQIARAALAASSTCEGEVAAFYCATARVVYERAVEDLKQLHAALVAREREILRRAGPLQTALPVTQGAP